jgi:hypothetical protein
MNVTEKCEIEYEKNGVKHVLTLDEAREIRAAVDRIEGTFRPVAYPWLPIPNWEPVTPWWQGLTWSNQERVIIPRRR